MKGSFPLPSVSVLVPVYGVERFIERCARSLFSQDYQNAEFVFTNDCTPDSSIEVLKRVLEDYPQRHGSVRIVEHDRNRGLAAARNTGLDNSKGEYILHVDSDDYLEPGALSAMVEAATSSGADMVVFDMNTVYSDRVVPRHDRIEDSKAGYIRQLLHREVVLGVWGKLFRREICEESGLRFIEGLDYGEDYVMSPRLAYFAGKIVKLNRPLYNYVQYNDGAYTKNISDRSVDSIIQAVAVLEEFFVSVPDSWQYQPMLAKMKIRNKIDLLKTTSTAQRKRIAGLYADLDARRADIPLADRLVLGLAEKGRWRLLDHYVKTGLAIKKFAGKK